MSPARRAQIGVSALFGFIVLFGMIPMQGFFGKRFGVLRKQMVAYRDDRIRKLSDMLQGIQVLKLYAWEQPFQASVLNVREREGAKLRAASWMKVRGMPNGSAGCDAAQTHNTALAHVSDDAQGLNETMFFMSPALISLCTFLPYAAFGNPLSPDVVFAVMALFGVIRLDMTNLFPKGVEAASEAWCACAPSSR